MKNSAYSGNLRVGQAGFAGKSREPVCRIGGVVVLDLAEQVLGGGVQARGLRILAALLGDLSQVVQGAGDAERVAQGALVLQGLGESALGFGPILAGEGEVAQVVQRGGDAPPVTCGPPDAQRIRKVSGGLVAVAVRVEVLDESQVVSDDGGFEAAAEGVAQVQGAGEVRAGVVVTLVVEGGLAEQIFGVRLAGGVTLLPEEG